MSGVVRGDDGVKRCAWGSSAPEYVAYHDLEWGRPVADDSLLYEKLCLEGFQSGLSWESVCKWGSPVPHPQGKPRAHW